MVILQFITFNTEKCCDYLTITDGDGTTLMGMTKGSSLPATVVSRTNLVTIRFRSDHSNTAAGWNISWSTEAAGVSALNSQHL